jgi:hypothetical protein
VLPCFEGHTVGNPSRIGKSGCGLARRASSNGAQRSPIVNGGRGESGLSCDHQVAQPNSAAKLVVLHGEDEPCCTRPAGSDPCRGAPERRGVRPGRTACAYGWGDETDESTTRCWAVLGPRPSGQQRSAKVPNGHSNPQLDSHIGWNGGHCAVYGMQEVRGSNPLGFTQVRGPIRPALRPTRWLMQQICSKRGHRADIGP